jgi:vanillate O-demethylase ferredoxin subunit
MLAAFERATAGLPAPTVHVEYFAAKEPVAVSGGFEVVLARSGSSVFVPEHSTILDAMLAAGIAVEHSCLEGVCGTCETKVLEGIPDHRDMVLSAPERASNRTMMICCSGSKTGRLVLDL